MKKASYETILQGFKARGGKISEDKIFCCFLNTFSANEPYIDFGSIINDSEGKNWMSQNIIVTIPKIKTVEQFTPKIYEKYTKFLDYKIKYLSMKKKLKMIDNDF